MQTVVLLSRSKPVFTGTLPVTRAAIVVLILVVVILSRSILPLRGSG